MPKKKIKFFDSSSSELLQNWLDADQLVISERGYRVQSLTPLTVTSITNYFLLLVFEANNSIADKEFGGNS